jgi:peptidoglycan-associated lipoprotein
MNPQLPSHWVTDMMKNSIRSLLILALAATVMTGCKKNPYGVTPLRGPGGSLMGDSPGGPVGAGTEGNRVGSDAFPVTSQANADGTFPLPGPDFELKFNQDPAPLKAHTVYFDFDSSSVKRSEYDKLAAVGEYLKSNPRNALLVEGHCDERGTEEYNRSLGERRALALREYLANSGINAGRIITRSFGEDRPADPGHDEAAWSRNRRGEFVVLVPKQ